MIASHLPWLRLGSVRVGSVLAARLDSGGQPTVFETKSILRRLQTLCSLLQRIDMHHIEPCRPVDFQVRHEALCLNKRSFRFNERLYGCSGRSVFDRNGFQRAKDDGCGLSVFHRQDFQSVLARFLLSVINNGLDCSSRQLDQLRQTVKSLKTVEPSQPSRMPSLQRTHREGRDHCKGAPQCLRNSNPICSMKRIHPASPMEIQWPGILAREQSTFASALAGFTEGAEIAGVQVVWAGNRWPVAAETHAANHPARRAIHAGG